MTLPSSTQFIESLLSQLSTHTKPLATPTQDQSPRLSTLAASHPTLKPLLLTLHCIFPNELLLALDILDRRLVRRLIRDDNAPTNHRESQAEDLFYVISASAPIPRSAEPDPLSLSLSQKGYEVRLRAWNCSCPSFAMAAFRAPAGSGDEDEQEEEGEEGNGVYVFGGSLTRGATRRTPPVCKHLLACLLAVRCPGLVEGDDAVCVRVSREVLAGVCAGFGG
ncbi:Zinc finger, SWIM-type [Aspergillus terreus]|uniref:Zinc finger, SWIM-type n=1 Tax=Aspergillus terreus TaxID=33178 RepID=A0A5M3ZEM7_ASPTE|nr:hypothetical protein ATETN484_0016023500 [Aspergillus terreus]GFF21658.1 Zinc finger, SWIM-type [Aspergillus terreus]